MREEANIRYRKLIRKPIIEHRDKQITSLNRRSFHNSIKIEPKEVDEDSDMELEEVKQKRLAQEAHTLEMSKKVESI